jgi:hypothetical protein
MGTGIDSTDEARRSVTELLKVVKTWEKAWRLPDTRCMAGKCLLPICCGNNEIAFPFNFIATLLFRANLFDGDICGSESFQAVSGIRQAKPSQDWYRSSCGPNSLSRRFSSRLKA